MSVASDVVNSSGLPLREPNAWTSSLSKNKTRAQALVGKIDCNRYQVCLQISTGYSVRSE